MYQNHHTFSVRWRCRPASSRPGDSAHPDCWHQRHHEATLLLFAEPICCNAFGVFLHTEVVYRLNIGDGFRHHLRSAGSASAERSRALTTTGSGLTFAFGFPRKSPLFFPLGFPGFPPDTYPFGLKGYRRVWYVRFHLGVHRGSIPRAGGHREFHDTGSFNSPRVGGFIDNMQRRVLMLSLGEHFVAPSSRAPYGCGHVVGL